MPTSLPTDGTPLSLLDVANDVRSDDRVAVLRPTEADPGRQNITWSVARLSAYLMDLAGSATATGLTPGIVAALFAAAGPTALNAFVTEAELAQLVANLPAGNAARQPEKRTRLPRPGHAVPGHPQPGRVRGRSWPRPANRHSRV